ncbi:MAG: hypothetical protein ACRDXX_11180, partial [Stackebrandtia sp.]
LPHRVTLTASPDSVDAHLSAALGTDVHLCIHIGPARANRKPVLQLLDADARTVGFAKIGFNELTRSLVDEETAALRRLSQTRLQRLRAPRVLHAGSWRGNSVLVQEALPGWSRPARSDPRRLADAMRELAECLGVEDASLSKSGYAATLHERLDVLAERADPDAATLVEAGRRLLRGSGEQRLAFGAWHGDWTPWNCTELSGEVLLWDFERFTSGVPIGFDALHYSLQSDIVTRGGDPTTAVLSLLAGAARLLRPFNVDADASAVCVRLYLVDLAARYLADRQAEAGAPLGALGRWLLPTLLRHVTADGGTR